MNEFIRLTNPILEDLGRIHVNGLLLLGLALLAGTVGGKLFQRIKVPQVVGYIIIGIILGQSGFNIIDREMVRALQPLNSLALGTIGFMIGGEIKRSLLIKYGRKFLIVLLSEGLSAFLLVFLSIGILGSLIFGHPELYWPLGILMGAIASATAPAATTDVLWELRSRGPLTTMILGIVAMDDALSLFLFAIANTVAAVLIGQHHEAWWIIFTHPVYEIILAIVIGGAGGFVLGKTLRQQTEKDRLLATTLGMLMLVIGVSLAIGADMLLATMALGIVLTNYAPRLSQQIFAVVHGFTPPIYTLFFVLIGAKFQAEQVSFTLLIIAVIYIVARIVGKMYGCYMGAKWAKAPRRVQKNLPLCLFSQAGVAIGLSIVAYQTFPGFIGDTIVVVITVSTFVVQLVGPILTRIAVTRSEEAGLNITEDDLIRKTRAKDIMDAQPPFIYADTPLTHILSTFHNDAHLYYPVVDRERRIIGIISVDTIKTTVLESLLTEFVIAEDLKEPVFQLVTADCPLDEVREVMDRYSLDYLPVVKDGKILVGFIERREVSKYIRGKILEMQRKSEELDFSG